MREQIDLRLSRIVCYRPDDCMRLQRSANRAAVSHRPLNACLNDSSRGERSVNDFLGNRRQLQLGATSPGRASLPRKGAGIDVNETFGRWALRELPQEIDCAGCEGRAQAKREVEPKWLLLTVQWIEQVRLAALHCEPNFRWGVEHQYSYTNGLCGVCFAHDDKLLSLLDFNGLRRLSLYMRKEVMRLTVEAGRPDTACRTAARPVA